MDKSKYDKHYSLNSWSRTEFRVPIYVTDYAIKMMLIRTYPVNSTPEPKSSFKKPKRLLPPCQLCEKSNRKASWTTMNNKQSDWVCFKLFSINGNIKIKSFCWKPSINRFVSKILKRKLLKTCRCYCLKMVLSIQSVTKIFLIINSIRIENHKTQLSFDKRLQNINLRCSSFFHQWLYTIAAGDVTISTKNNTKIGEFNRYFFVESIAIGKIFYFFYFFKEKTFSKCDKIEMFSIFLFIEPGWISVQCPLSL